MSAIITTALLIAVGIYGYFRDRPLVRAAINEGQRRALKEAILALADRADVALYMAPDGELRAAVVRARAICDVSMDLRRQLSEVR
jgi:hypothetical protein